MHASRPTAHPGLTATLVVAVAATLSAAAAEGGTTVYDVTVAGSDIAGSEHFVASLVAGDHVVVDNVSGTVDFNPTHPGAGCTYAVNANGLARAIYDDPTNAVLCYADDQGCTDPLPSSGHAGLYRMLNTTRSFVGTAGATFNVTASRQLYLGVNDCPATPNSGSFSARVTVSHPDLSIDDVTVTEGSSGATNATFTVTCDPAPASGQTVTVNYATADGSATAPGDYATAVGTLTYTAGQASKTVTVAVVGDTLDEPDETFTLTLSGASGANLVDASGTGTITDDDPTPSLSVNDVTVTEGSSGTTNAVFTVTLSAASGRTVTVNHATADGTATAPADYASTSGALTFSSGQTTKTVTVAVVGDALDEPNEVYDLNLSGATNATVADGQGLGSITDDDPTPSLAVDDVTVTEGSSGTTNATFTVTLSAASGRTVTVDYSTVGGSAIAPGDYTSTSGTLTFTAGQTTRPITVAVVGDTLDEDDEVYFVGLSNAANATLGDASGLGTITDDDPQVAIMMGTDISVTEGDSGTVNAAFTVNLLAASGRTVSAEVYTADGTATQPGDYTGLTQAVSFAPGDTTETVNVAVIGDTLHEPNETFTLHLHEAVNATIADSTSQCTIVDDDGVTVGVADTSATEGDGAGATLPFAVTLSGPAAATVTVHWATVAGGSATAGVDYAAAAGTLTFAVGDTAETAPVPLLGDLLDELDETVLLELSSPTGGATIADGQATGTILDDDPMPGLTARGAEVVEGMTAVLWLSLDAASGLAVGVDYQSVDGSAQAGADYQEASGTAAIPAGATAGRVLFATLRDSLAEGAESFAVDLADPSNAVLQTIAVAIAICDDDDGGACLFGDGFDAGATAAWSGAAP